MMIKKKIALVTPLLDLGGGQRYVSELANYWVSLNHDITIILLRSGDSFYEISNKVKIISLGYKYNIGEKRLTKLMTSVSTALKLRKAIKNLEPDFVLSILSSTNLLTLMSTRYLKSRIYVNDIMSPNRKRPQIERLARKLLYPKADGVITLTERAKNIVIKETKSKNVVVIPNPISKFIVDNSIKKEKIIINVGRLHGAKGQEYLLDACSKLNDKEWKFVILGEGPLRKPLEEQAKELGIEDRLYMPGAVNNVNEWLSRASIFAFPSVSEGLPIALIEAMNASLPCVSFNCETGPSELIENGINGFLVDVRDVNNFVSRIKELIENEKLRDKFSTKSKNAVKKFSMNKISNQIIEFCSK